LAEVLLGLAKHGGGRGQLIGGGIEPGAAKDALGAQQVGTALLQRLVRREIANERHDDHGDGCPDEAEDDRGPARQQPATDAVAVAEGCREARWSGPRYPRSLTQTSGPRASEERTSAGSAAQRRPRARHPNPMAPSSHPTAGGDEPLPECRRWYSCQCLHETRIDVWCFWLFSAGSMA